MLAASDCVLVPVVPFTEQGARKTSGTGSVESLQSADSAELLLQRVEQPSYAEAAARCSPASHVHSTDAMHAGEEEESADAGGSQREQALHKENRELKALHCEAGKTIAALKNKICNLEAALAQSRWETAMGWTRGRASA